MTTLNVLTAARALLADHWTSACPRHNREEYCIITATSAAALGEEFYQPAIRVLVELAPMPLTKFNATHTQTDVLALFDRAIASVQA